MNQFKLLVDVPQYAEQIAHWYYTEWCEQSNRYTLSQVHDKVAGATRRLGAHLITCLIYDDELIGCAELKFHEMDIYPEYEFWLGGVYVDKRHRRDGAASKIVTDIIKRARDANIDTLYLQTEDLSGGLYTKLGFMPIEQVTYKGVDVLVMRLPLY